MQGKNDECRDREIRPDGSLLIGGNKAYARSLMVKHRTLYTEDVLFDSHRADQCNNSPVCEKYTGLFCKEMNLWHLEMTPARSSLLRC